MNIDTERIISEVRRLRLRRRRRGTSLSCVDAKTKAWLGVCRATVQNYDNV